MVMMTIEHVVALDMVHQLSSMEPVVGQYARCEYNYRFHPVYGSFDDQAFKDEVRRLIMCGIHEDPGNYHSYTIRISRLANDGCVQVRLLKHCSAFQAQIMREAWQRYLDKRAREQFYMMGGEWP